MDECKTEQKPRQWYNSYEFPLIPQFKYRPGDKYNTDDFSLNWLCFKFWTLDYFDFEVSAGVNCHWGLYINGILPYLRWVVGIPLPNKWCAFMQEKLWRKPKCR